MYEKTTMRLNRSYDEATSSGNGNPYRLLAAAIVFQCAVDCDAIRAHGDEYIHQAKYHGSIRELTRPALLDFINGEWIEFLLMWSGMDIEAVRENLIERLGA